MSVNVPLLDDFDRAIDRGGQKTIAVLNDVKSFMFRTSLVQFAVGVILGLSSLF